MPRLSEAAASRLPVGRILAPRSVGVFGASDDRGKWAGRIMYYLALHGYAGEVIPINPRRDVVQGRKCYARVADAPPIDVAIIAIPADKAVDAVRECAEAGVGSCLIITSGFAEVEGGGVDAQKTLVDIARRSGMRLVGPNCLGIINVLNGMALTSARVLEVEKLHRGAIGFVTQSGALMLSVFNRAHDAGIGFSQLVSVGNQADLELCDFLEHMIGDPDTKAICLHIEGLKDGRRFLGLLRRARLAAKPVFVLKTGRSAAGEAAARSHTASMAGAYPVFRAACRQEGAVLCDDPDTMILAADMAVRFGPCPAGDVGIVSSSGGINGVVLDRMADFRLPVATFAAATRSALAQHMLPSHLGNPVDLGTRKQEVGGGDKVGEDILRIVAADPSVGVVMVPLTTSPNYEATAAALARGVAACGKPGFVIVTPGSVATEVRRVIRGEGVPVCDRVDDGLRMLRAYRDVRPPAVSAAASAPQPALSIDPPRAGYLSEPEAKALLAKAGMRTAREQTVATREEAIKAADAIGYPVVLKGVSARIVHKSDAGLVKTGLADRAQVGAAYDAVAGALRRQDPDARHCLVAEMVAGGAELILGVKRDPQFGPVVMVGAGGVLVELLEDTQLALAPVDAATAEAMLRRLRVFRLLQGYRGKPPLDVAAAVDALVRLGRLAQALGDRLAELDINPLIVREAGQGAIAVDARAVIA